MRNGLLSFPDAELINEHQKCKIPYYMVADEAFPLSHNMMRSYPVEKLVIYLLGSTFSIIDYQGLEDVSKMRLESWLRDLEFSENRS